MTDTAVATNETATKQVKLASTATAGLQLEVENLADQAALIEVVDDATQGVATDFLVDVKKLTKKTEESKEAAYRPLKDALDEITNQYNPILKNLKNLEQSIKTNISGYLTIKAEQERQRIAAERKALEEEALRLAGEMMDAASEQAGRAADAALAKAAELEAKGLHDLAAKFRRLAENRQAELAAKANEGADKALEEARKAAERKANERPNLAVKTESGSQSFATKRWDFEVMDPAQLPRQYLKVDEQAIRQAVRDGKREIPGVRIFEAMGVSVRV